MIQDHTDHGAWKERSFRRALREFQKVRYFKGLFTWRWGTSGRWGNPPSRGRKIKRVYMQFYNPGVLGWGFLRLLLRLQLRSLSRVVPSSHVEKDERWIRWHIHVFIHESVTGSIIQRSVFRSHKSVIRWILVQSGFDRSLIWKWMCSKGTSQIRNPDPDSPKGSVVVSIFYLLRFYGL